MNSDLIHEENKSEKEEMIAFIIQSINRMRFRELDLVFRFVKNII